MPVVVSSLESRPDWDGQIVLRYFMGYWPAKLPCFLNMILMIGYGTIDCIIGGQILSAVSGGSMSIVVGIVIVALISWVIAVFGMAIFQKYERYPSYPQSPCNNGISSDIAC